MRPGPNRLAKESSPYLRQHAHNPVDWYPWGEEAFAKARREDKPVFLSIGYSSCHWCHVMERESFENEEIARVLNEHFVAIKVDREERPDVDDVYMTAVQLTIGARRLAALGVPPPRRAAVLRRDLLSARRPARAGRVPDAPRRGSPRRGASGAPTSRRRRGELAAEIAREPGPHRRPRREAPLGRRRRDAPDGDALARSFDAAPRRLRRGAEVPAPPRARVAPPRGAPRATPTALGDGVEDARGDGARRHPRPPRRRLPPLLDRRAVAPPALREDADRQRAAPRRSTRGRARPRGETSSRRTAREIGDYLLREMRGAGGGLLRGDGRGLGRGRGKVLCLGPGADPGMPRRIGRQFLLRMVFGQAGRQFPR